MIIPISKTRSWHDRDDVTVRDKTQDCCCHGSIVCQRQELIETVPGSMLLFAYGHSVELV